jgi:lipoyl(octanoyl) transferase
VLHGPGQLCIYPIVPLPEVGWTVGEYLSRLQTGLIATITRLRLPAGPRPGSYGVWGQFGLLAALGIRVQDGIAHYGAFLNVCPDMSSFGYIDTAVELNAANGMRVQRSPMSSLMAARRGAINMSSVRTSVIESLAEAWGTDHYHIHAGHPWLIPELDAPPRAREIAR